MRKISAMHRFGRVIITVPKPEGGKPTQIRLEPDVAQALARDLVRCAEKARKLKARPTFRVGR